MTVTAVVNGSYPDSKVHGRTWGESGADRTQVGPMNFAIWVVLYTLDISRSNTRQARYGVSFLRSFEEMYLEKSREHCIMFTMEVSWYLSRFCWAFINVTSDQRRGWWIIDIVRNVVCWYMRKYLTYVHLFEKKKIIGIFFRYQIWFGS